MSTIPHKASPYAAPALATEQNPVPALDAFQEPESDHTVGVFRFTGARPDTVGRRMRRALARRRPSSRRDDGITLVPLLDTARMFATENGACELAAEITARGTEDTLLDMFTSAVGNALLKALDTHQEHFEAYFFIVLGLQLLLSNATEIEFDLDPASQRLTVLTFVGNVLMDSFLNEAGYDEAADPYALAEFAE